jgi:hypothetical protein
MIFIRANGKMRRLVVEAAMAHGLRHEHCQNLRNQRFLRHSVNENG